MIRHKVQLMSNQNLGEGSLMNDQLLTPDEVAERFHKHRKTVLRWRELPWLKLTARTFLMRREDLNKFLEAKCQHETT